MARIIPHPGLPMLGTEEFDKWLRDFHAAHNGPGKSDPAVTDGTLIEIMAVGDDTQADIEISYPNARYRVTEKGKRALQS